MARSNYRYNQLAIGTCGHVVGTWPQVSESGGKNPEVPCDECTRARFKFDSDETTSVWVRIKTSESVGLSKPKPPKPKREKKPKSLSPWQALLRQEGLF